jgi:hypothetical protein
MMKIKKLCDLGKKEIEKNLPQIAEIVKYPEYICRDCCRVSGSKKNLCKPTNLPEAQQ